MFRPATRDDLQELAGWIRSRQECEFWAGPYLPYPLAPELLPADIELDSAESVVMLEGQRLLAFGQLLEKDRDSGHLARLIVNPACRRQGQGSKLVRELLARARRRGYRVVTLNVDRDNAAAQALYAHLGFRHGRRPPGEYASSRSDYMLCELL